ncbi:hypothetical protein D3C76_1154580 [compost metagenome]
MDCRPAVTVPDLAALRIQLQRSIRVREERLHRPLVHHAALVDRLIFIVSVGHRCFRTPLEVGFTLTGRGGRNDHLDPLWCLVSDIHDVRDIGFVHVIDLIEYDEIRTLTPGIRRTVAGFGARCQTVDDRAVWQFDVMLNVAGRVHVAAGRINQLR